MENNAKLMISMRYWLLGREYYNAIDAMEFALQFHTGFRKDGVTPEFEHQVNIAHYVRTLSGVMYPEETLSTVFLHDVREDYGVEDSEIRNRFGNMVADAVDAMTKEFRGVRRSEEHVFATIANNPIASIAKGGDRIHNLNSMVGVFSTEKQKAYVDEAKTYFFPMLKTARRQFPKQEAAYENIKHMLTTQITLVEAIHANA